MKLLICGSRDWDDAQAVLRWIRVRLERHGEDLTIIAGAARGADRIGASWAKTLGLDLIEVRADWQRYGKSAGPRRNRIMLDMQPDEVGAFWDGVSVGTKDCIGEARRRGIPVEVILATPLETLRSADASCSP